MDLSITQSSSSNSNGIILKKIFPSLTHSLSRKLWECKEAA
jgi:hypothetical protein